MYKTSTATRQPPDDGVTLPPILKLNPFWLAMPAAQHSASAMAGFDRVATEWLSFIHRRLGEDARLAGQLAASKSPAEFWGRYADFLQRAVQDYWQEYAALTKLAGENVNASSGGSREHAEAEETRAPPVARAA